MNQEITKCQNCQKEFTIEPDDFDFYKKIKVPAPTWCPECREQRRIAFRNERSLYKRKCDLCGEIVVSRVSPDKSYPMYCKKCWWSDKWDVLSYGRDYDFSKPFFEQFKDLLFSTPHISILNANTVNSDWVNQETDDKNCYLNVGGHYNEDSAYNTYELYGKNCFDSFWIFQSELGYENVFCKRCYQTLFSENCFDCLDTILSYDCRNCQNIFGCAGLRNKEYCILNKQYSKEEYEKLLPKIKKHMEEIPYVDKKGRTYRYGEFFPIELSPFGYNETAAQDYYPLSREQAIKNGYPWSDYESDIKYKQNDYFGRESRSGLLLS